MNTPFSYGSLRQYLLLAGRSGITNNPIISSDGVGSIFGSKATGPSVGLALNAVAGSILGPLTPVVINRNTATLRGFSPLLTFGIDETFSFANISVIGDVGTGTNPSLLGLVIGGNFTVDDDSLGGPGILLFGFVSTFQNPPGVAKNIGATRQTFLDQVTYIADGAHCTIPLGSSDASFTSTVNISVINGGTVTAGDIRGYLCGTYVSTGVTLATNIGYKYGGVTGDPTAVITGPDIGYTANDGDVFSSTRHISYQSTGPIRQLSHRGPAVFGADAAPTGAYILEAIGAMHGSSSLLVDSWVANKTPVRLAGRGADITDTTLTSVTGVYRVSVYLVEDAADLAAGAVTAHIKYNDGTAARDVLIGPIALTGLGTQNAGSFIIARLASGNLTYGTTHTGIFGTATFALDVSIEKVA